MQDIKNVKILITSLLKENKIYKLMCIEQNKMIDELKYKIEQLESDLEYSKVNGGLKKLILKKD